MIHQYNTNNNELTKVCESKEDSIGSKNKDNSEISLKNKSAFSDNISQKEENIIGHDFIPEIYNVFNLDFQKLAFVQKEMKDTNELRDELRKIAFSKITHTEQPKESEINEEQSENEDEEEEEEEEEFSSFDYPGRKNSSCSLSSHSPSSKKEHNDNIDTTTHHKFKSSFNL